jgi:hypothetical protein
MASTDKQFGARVGVGRCLRLAFEVHRLCGALDARGKHGGKVRVCRGHAQPGHPHAAIVPITAPFNAGTSSSSARGEVP